MNYFWDIIALVFIVSAIVSCYRKGFMYSLVNTVGAVAAIIFSIVFSKPVSKSLYDTFFRSRMTEGFEKLFSSVKEIDMTVFQDAVNEKFASLPGTLGSQMQPVFNEYVENWFESFQRADFSSLAADFTKSVAEPVMTGFLRCVAFLLMFLVLSLVVKLIAQLLKGINYIPLLGSVNALLGSVFGLIQGFIHVLILCGILWVVLSFTGGIDGIITPAILNDTYILKAVFSIFPILGGILTQL